MINVNGRARLIFLFTALWQCTSACAATNFQKEDYWCSVNDYDSRNDDGSKDWEGLANKHVHMVRASKQVEAKRQLKNVPILPLTKEQAEAYLQVGDALGGNRFTYLVRSAALYLKSSDITDSVYRDAVYNEAVPGSNKPGSYNYKFPFEVSISSSRKKLDILNGNLGDAKIPFNVALVVDSPEEVTDVETKCLSAM
jgi:hypothetical protein